MSKGINIPSPDELKRKQEIIQKEKKTIKFYKDLDFIEKANSFNIGEKITAIISKELITNTDITKIYAIHISSNINFHSAYVFINTVVKPMFEEKNWKVTVVKLTEHNAKCLFYWTTNFFGDYIVGKYYFGSEWHSRSVLITLE